MVMLHTPITKFRHDAVYQGTWASKISWEMDVPPLQIRAYKLDCVIWKAYETQNTFASDKWRSDDKTDEVKVVDVSIRDYGHRCDNKLEVGLWIY